MNFILHILIFCPELHGFGETLKDFKDPTPCEYMYFEVWIDLSRKDEIAKKLRETCEEVHEVFYDYHYIVRVEDEEALKIDGVRRYRRHYDC